MLRRLELKREHHAPIIARCRARGIRFMSTPFDEDSADFLASCGMAVFKIPSGEATNLPFLEHVGRKRKPVFLSTGMCTLAEVRAALVALRAGGARDIALLHCVSCYPTAAADCNLRAMDTLAREFRLPSGFSDHTLGLEMSVAAAARGARLLEKHFTLDRGMKGPDHSMSLEPGELKSLVAAVRRVSAALGDGIKRPRPCELEVMRVARKSLVLARPAAAGERLTRSMLAAKRPGTGLSPARLKSVLGRRLKAALPADALLSLRHLS
jgi:N-acetylneuraminate synthase/N,N'-diacetyllegionaminate synthase